MESLFTGITIDIAPITKSLVDAMKIGLPAMIAVVGFKKGVTLIKSSIKG